MLNNKRVFYSNKILFIISLFIIIELLVGLASFVLPPLVTVIFVLLPFALLAYIIKPAYCYYSFIILLPFWNISLYHIGIIDIRSADLLLICLFFAFLINAIIHKKTKIEGSVLAIPILSLGIWAFFSAFRGSTSGITLLTHFFYGVAIYFLTINVINSQKLARNAINVWIISGLIAALIGSIQFIKSPYINFERFIQIRSSAFFVSQNMLGNFLSICILLTLGCLLIEDNRFKRFMLLSFVGIMLTGLLSTMSRTAFTGFICGAFFFAIFCQKLRKPLLLAFIISLTIAFVITKGSMVSLFYARYLEPFSEELVKVSPARVASWKNAWNLFLSSPVIGIGYGNYTKIIEETGSKGLSHIHSVHLAVLTELGIVGIFLFYYLILRIILFVKKAINVIKKDTSLFNLSLAAASGLIAYLVCTFFQAIYLHERNMWAFMGLAMAIILSSYQAVEKNR